jgi:hypothetical protein
VRQTIVRLITDHLRLRPDAPTGVSWRGRDLDFTDALFDGTFTSPGRRSRAATSFAGATFSGGDIRFAGATFSGGDIVRRGDVLGRQRQLRRGEVLPG